MRVSVHTHTYNGEYAPYNTAAIWVEDSSGAFITTVKLWGLRYWVALSNWLDASGAKYDGVSAATRQSHGEISGIWDMKDKSDAIVPYGMYRVQVEFTESDYAAKHREVSIILDGVAHDTAFDDTQFFSDFNVSYTPTSIKNNSEMQNHKHYPLSEISFEMTHSSLRIEFIESALKGDVRICVFSAAGNCVAQSYVKEAGQCPTVSSEKSVRISLSHISGGVYVLAIIDSRSNTPVYSRTFPYNIVR